MAKARNRASIVAILMLLVVSGLLFPCGPLHVVQPAVAQSTSVSADDATLSVGQSTTVNVWVKNFPPDGYGLGAYDIRIYYDAAKIQVTGVSPGDSPFGAPVFSIQSNYVSIVQFITTWPGPMGNARIAGLQITSLASGQTTLTPTINTLANVKGDYVTAVPLAGTVNRVATPAPTPTPPPPVPYPTVSSFGASGATATSAILNGYLASLGTASSVQAYFEWGLTTSYGTSTAAQTLTSPGYFSFTLTGLSPSTTYYYRADAVGNGAGYGVDVTFTTASATPTVTTQSPSGVTANSATLNAYLGGLGTASSVQVSFQWGPTTSYGSQTTTQITSSAAYFSFALTGLSPNTTYHYRAYAAGNGVGYGQDIAFTSAAITTPTPTPAAPPTVSTTAASGVTASSATLNGNLVSLGTAASVQVYLEWGLTTSYSTSTAAQTVTSAGTFGSAISGLSPGTAYHFRAKAVGNGAIAYGQDMSFSTSPGSTTSPAPSGGTSLSSGAIVKIVILVIVFLLLLGVLAFLVWTWFLRRPRTR